MGRMYEASNPRRPQASWTVATPIGRNASTTAEGTLGMSVTTTAMRMLLSAIASMSPE
jgi:hypothetical protein